VDQEGDGEDFEDLRGLKVVGDVDEAHKRVVLEG
jgi:hypothetical protein